MSINDDGMTQMVTPAVCRGQPQGGPRQTAGVTVWVMPSSFIDVRRTLVLMSRVGLWLAVLAAVATSSTAPPAALERRRRPEDRHRHQPECERRQGHSRPRHRRAAVQLHHPRKPAEVGEGASGSQRDRLRVRTGRMATSSSERATGCRRGHVLLWHQQTPAWVFAGEAGKTLDRETALSRLRNHISTSGESHIADGWDVVNEALRRRRDATPWSEAIGEDYIAKAFEFAREADPGAELYYNDYNLWKPATRDAAGLKAKGLRVDDRRAGALGGRAIRHSRRSTTRSRRSGGGDAGAPSRSWTWTSCRATPTCGAPTSRRRRRSAPRPMSTRTGCRSSSSWRPLRRRIHAVPEARRRACDDLGKSPTPRRG